LKQGSEAKNRLAPFLGTAEIFHETLAQFGSRETRAQAKMD